MSISITDLSSLFKSNNVNALNQSGYLNNYLYTGIRSGSFSGYNNYGKNNANNLSQSAASFVTNAKQYGQSLNKDLQNLMGKGSEKSVFTIKRPVSSNTDYMTTQSSNTDKNSTFKTTTVEISQLAKGQENSGSKLKATGMDFETNKNYQFEIEVGGKKTQISFTTKTGDNNQAVQQKMADAINAAGIGVKASVTYDSASKNSSLNLVSSQTGTKEGGGQYFTIADKTTGGKAVSIAGVGSVTQQAQDAVYRINDGPEKTSKSNTVDLGNGVTAQFKKTTQDLAEPLQVSMGSDYIAQQNKVRDMVNQYNGLLEAANDNSNDRRSAGLARQLSDAAKAYSSSLSRIGINVGKDGYLSIDEDKMKKSAENGGLEKYFKNDSSSQNYGFSYRVSRIASNVEKNPMNYVGRDSMTNNIGSSNYLDSQANYLLLNPRINQWMNVGILFDSMF